jgi:hypothetical protein
MAARIVLSVKGEGHDSGSRSGCDSPTLTELAQPRGLSNELPEGSPKQAAAQAVADKMRDVYQELTQLGAAHEVTEAEARTLLEELAT